MLFEKSLPVNNRGLVNVIKSAGTGFIIYFIKPVLVLKSYRHMYVVSNV